MQQPTGKSGWTAAPTDPYNPTGDRNPAAALVLLPLLVVFWGGVATMVTALTVDGGTAARVGGITLMIAVTTSVIIGASRLYHRARSPRRRRARIGAPAVSTR
jgi:hypothetical protein